MHVGELAGAELARASRAVAEARQTDRLGDGHSEHPQVRRPLGPGDAVVQR